MCVPGGGGGGLSSIMSIHEVLYYTGILLQYSMQRQKAETAYFSSEQLLLFAHQPG